MKLVSLFAILLVLMYILVCLISGMQTARIILYGHSLRSFQFGFLMLAFLWTSLRVVFFGQVAGVWPTPVLLMLLWYPVDLQFAMFALLVVFYANLLHERDWERTKKYCYCVYGVATIFIILATTGFIFYGCSLAECQLEPELERIHHLYMSAQFFILVAVYGIYGYRLSNLDQIHLSLRETSNMVSITFLASALFLSRCLYNFAAAFNLWNLEVVSDRTSGVGWLVFCLLFVWEILPTLIVLLYFRHIPKTTHIRAWSCCRLCPWWCYGPYSQEEVLAVSGSSPGNYSDGRNGASHLHGIYHDVSGFMDRGDVDDIYPPYPSIYQNYFPTHLGAVEESPTKPNLTATFPTTSSFSTASSTSNPHTNLLGVRTVASQPSEPIYEGGHEDHDSSSGSGSDFEEDENEPDPPHLNQTQSHHSHQHGQHGQHSHHGHGHHGHRHDLPTDRIARTGATNSTPPPA